ncbi:MAG TPA: (Fe-S)-binding protein [Candidatus Acidoferrales bacterium]|nr:(Fe-S)-binding protein [Candidatus Acidoferrales bacterium]
MVQGGGYIGTERPKLEDLDRCTRCGLCEQACPTYRLLKFEPDSPRGRIFLMKEVAEGRAGVDANLAEHLYACLGCRACETACPSGVEFGKLLESGRHQVELHGEILPERRGWRLFRAFAFERILPNPWLFHVLMFPARLLQAVPGLLALVQSLPLPQKLRQLVRMIPQANSTGAQAKLDGRHEVDHYKLGSLIPAQGERRARVGLFVGCVMGSLFSHVHRATIRVLTRNGCEVVIIPGQWCCGALNLHAGERKHAATMARANVAAFNREQVDAIIVNSAGCGAAMKEYAHLLDGESESVMFSRKVKDASEFLAELGLRSKPQRRAVRVTYQDACHLAHGQGVRQQPRFLLEQIPGLTFVEMPHADRCCGAAGVYNLTHGELSGRILAEKLDEIALTRAEVVVTTNPGCTMQVQAGLMDRHMNVRVCHLMELLDESSGNRP